MELRIAHTADNHLDEAATCSGHLVRDEAGINIRFTDRVRCVAAFKDGAIAARCSLAVLAGDLFERPRPSPREYLAAIAILDELAARMPVVVVADNHGLTQSAFDPHAVEPLAGRRNGLHVFSTPGLRRLKTSDGQEVQVGIVPSPRRSVLLTKDEYRGLMPEEINAVISGKLKVILAGMRQQIAPGLPAILVAHVMLRGADLGGTDSVMLASIAVDPEDLEGWDYVALGDVHRAQKFLEGLAWYAGSSDRTDFGEEHERKSWNLVTLQANDEGRSVPVVERLETPARRYLTLSPDELLDEARLNECMTAPLDTVPVVRVKGTVSEEDVQKLAPILALWRKVPTFTDQLEVMRVTRARNATLTDTLSPEAALRTWATDHGHADTVEALVAEQVRLMEAIGK